MVNYEIIDFQKLDCLKLMPTFGWNNDNKECNLKVEDETYPCV